MPNTTVRAAATGLPFVLIPAEPMPGLADTLNVGISHIDLIEQERAMNDVLVALTAMLEEAAHD